MVLPLYDVAAERPDQVEGDGSSQALYTWMPTSIGSPGKILVSSFTIIGGSPNDEHILPMGY